MKKIKRIFSLLLILTIVASVIPTPAKAMTIRKVTSVKVKEKKGKYKWYKKGKKTIYEKYKYMQLSWKKVTGVSGYEIYRYGEASKQWYKVKTTSKKVTTYAIPEIEKGMKVQLKVCAYKNTSSGKIYSEFSSVRSFKGKRDYAENAKMKHGGYDKKYKFWDAPKIKTKHYRFLSEYAFVIQNKYRTAKGIAPLEWNEAVYKGAKIRSKELIEKYDHERPNGKTIFSAVNDRLKANEPHYSLSENIACGQTSARETMKAWKASKNHYESLMANKHIYGAISIYIDDGDYYSVSLLARISKSPKWKNNQ